MGSSTSQIQPGGFEAEPYIVLDGEPEGPVTPSRAQRIVNSGFRSPWTQRFPSSVTPTPRTSHFFVHLKDQNLAICGYGISSEPRLLSDIWQLDLTDLKWSPIQITDDTITPRNGTRAVLLGNSIALFGGYSGTSYLSDFHILDLTTSTVSRPNIQGPSPSGRIGHVMAEHNGEILVWGGYNGDWLSDLWLLDTRTWTWTEIPNGVNGRTSPAYVNHEDSLYIFGASKVDPLLVYNWSSKTLSVVKTTGVTPRSELSQASMVAIGRYLILFGGKIDQDKFGLMYGYDTVRHKWFVFHVIPDGITTTVDQGMVDKNGFFLLPTGWSSSMVYCEKERKVMIFLGAPMVEPLRIWIIEVGESISMLNLGADMLDMVTNR